MDRKPPVFLAGGSRCPGLTSFVDCGPNYARSDVEVKSVAGRARFIETDLSPPKLPSAAPEMELETRHEVLDLTGRIPRKREIEQMALEPHLP